MKDYSICCKNGRGEVADGIRRFLLGALLFIGFFGGLLWVLQEVFDSVFAVLKAVH